MTEPDTTALRALCDRAEKAFNPARLDPATVRALCDGYDEAQRLRAHVEREQAHHREVTMVHLANLGDERAAARQALADLIGELRGLEANAFWHPAACEQVVAWASLRAVVDRHDPEAT